MENLSMFNYISQQQKGVLNNTRKEDTHGQQIYLTLTLTFDQTKKLHARAMRKSLLFSRIV